MGFGDPQEVRKWDDFNSSLDNPLFRGKKIGVDIMFYIHLALCRRIGAAEMLHVPPVPVTAIEEVLGSLLQLFKGEEGAERNITGMFVFDGKHHATKRREDAKRAAAQQASRDRLEALLATASAADFNDVQKLGMKLGTVREDMVELAVAFLLKNKAEVVGAPFEADSQLAYEEAVGNTVASLTIDSDMFMLGSQMWISQLRLPPHADAGAINLVARPDALAKLDNGEHWAVNAAGEEDRGQVQLYGAMCGNDYVPRPMGLGPKTILKSMATMRKSDKQRQKEMKRIANRKWPAGCGFEGKCTQYSGLLNIAANMYVG